MTNIAFVFPGQGSQSLGMLSDLASEYPAILSTFTQASEVLGYDLWELVQKGPEERLNQTENTQPALLASSVALWKVWQSVQGDTPKFLAGHSLGEYSALVCANALDFQTAISLAAQRGKFMQAAVPPGKGAMAAIIGLADSTVEELCQEASKSNEQVSPANYNSLGQVVVAGDTNAVNRLVILAKEAGAKLAKLIPVSVPSHCALMKPAADQLRKQLATINIRKPIIPVINNVDVTSYEENNLIADALVRQLWNPVRWVETIQYLVAEGTDTFIECGPGKVLSGLNKRIDANVLALSISDSAGLQKALELKTERLI